MLEKTIKKQDAIISVGVWITFGVERGFCDLSTPAIRVFTPSHTPLLSHAFVVQPISYNIYTVRYACIYSPILYSLNNPMRDYTPVCEHPNQCPD